jgi:hypothetical protein
MIMKLTKDRFEYPAGTEVFCCRYYNYGIAADDTAAYGVIQEFDE